MKLSDIHVAGRYVGTAGEIRKVLRMVQRHGGVVDLMWVSETHKRQGKPATGTSTPQLFARWAKQPAPSPEVRKEEGEKS